MSGLIFVALAAVWAVVLIPMALRHHDEAARTRAVDNFSDDLRVVARREAVTARESRLVVPSRLRRTPSAEATASTSTSAADASADVPAPRRGSPLGRPSAPAAPDRRSAPAPSPSAPMVPAQRRGSERARTAHRLAARAAAKRRRIVLGLLLLVTVGIGVGSAVGLLQPWAPLVPAGVAVSFLVLARVMVRREQLRWDAVVAAAAPAPAPAPAAPIVVTDLPRFAPGILVPPVPPVAPVPLVSGLDDANAVSVGLTAASEGAEGARVDGLWDPLPVTLPTYVTKPRAHRSVRTIDLLEPGVRSSGRNAADSALVAEAATAAPASAEAPHDRAVGS